MHVNRFGFASHWLRKWRSAANKSQIEVMQKKWSLNEKTSLYGSWARDLCDAGAVLDQQS